MAGGCVHYIGWRSDRGRERRMAGKLDAPEKKEDTQVKVVFNAIRVLTRLPTVEHKRGRIGFHAPN
jgi:hypothetical protein